MSSWPWPGAVTHGPFQKETAAGPFSVLGVTCLLPAWCDLSGEGGVKPQSPVRGQTEADKRLGTPSLSGGLRRNVGRVGVLMQRPDWLRLLRGVMARTSAFPGSKILGAVFPETRPARK